MVDIPFPMDLSWDRLTFHSFQSKDSTIGDSQGCGLSIRSNSPNSPNFWQSKLLEPWNVQSKNSPFDPRFFLPSFLPSLHSGLGFLFSAQNAQVLHNCSTKKLDVSDTFVKKSEKSPEISIQFRVDKSPFFPIHPHSSLQEIPCKKHRLASSQWLLQNLRWKEHDWGRQVMFR